MQVSHVLSFVFIVGEMESHASQNEDRISLGLSELVFQLVSLANTELTVISDFKVFKKTRKISPTLLMFLRTYFASTGPISVTFHPNTTVRV